MEDFQNIEIDDIRVETRAGDIFADIYFMLKPRPKPDWQSLFKSMYDRHRYLGCPMKQYADSIMQKWPESSIDQEITEKIRKDIADTNAMYRKCLETQTRDQAAAQERERRSAEERQQREAELKRKLLGDD